MLDLDAIYDVLVTNLEEYAGCSVVIADQSAPRPSYPFVTVKVIQEDDETGQLTVGWHAVPSEDPQWEHDVEYRYRLRPRLTISISAYDDTRAEHVEDVVRLCRQWFVIPQLGPRVLEELDAAVVELTPITDRDVVLEEQWERRKGFDVRMDVTVMVTIREATIESVEVRSGEDAWLVTSGGV